VSRAITIGTFEMLRPSAICSGMLAPAMSSTTATKKKNFRYRKRPTMTAMASTASSISGLTPRCERTYSSGRLASSAVRAMRPISTSSRTRSRVRKSSSFLRAGILLPPKHGIL
jgi:hypothetical protein